jgi:hypothetical protein
MASLGARPGQSVMPETLAAAAIIAVSDSLHRRTLDCRLSPGGRLRHALAMLVDFAPCGVDTH